jgi:hypothetical protein
MSTGFRISRTILRAFTLVLAGLLGVLSAFGAFATQVPLAADEEELEEVIIEGSPLWRLREQMRETEDAFYARFNQLNTNDDFDVHCTMEAPTGTRLRSRVCRVAYQMDAQATAAWEMLNGFAALAALEPGMTRAGDFVVDPEILRLERWDEYRRHALEVINSDPQLRRLARKREEMGKRYDAERKRQFRQRWWNR